MSTPTTIVDISQDPGLNYLSTPAVETVQQRLEKGLPAGNVIFNSVTEVRNVYIKQTTNVPGGSNGEVQFNNGNTFSGDPEFKYNPTTNQLEVDGTILVDGTITATSFRYPNGASVATVSTFSGDYNDLTNKPVISDTLSLTGGDFFIAKDETKIQLGQWAAQAITVGPDGIQLAGTGGVEITGINDAGVTLGGETSGTINFVSPTSGIDYNDLNNTPTIPTSFSSLVNGSKSLVLGSDGNVDIAGHLAVAKEGTYLSSIGKNITIGTAIFNTKLFVDYNEVGITSTLDVENMPDETATATIKVGAAVATMLSTDNDAGDPVTQYRGQLDVSYTGITLTLADPTTVTNWVFGDNNLKLPAGGDIVDSNGQSVLGGSAGNGASAYDIAVTNGFVGTEQAWLDSLVGAPGTTGANGQGVPTGGTTGQVLAKVDGTDYNTQWVNQTGGATDTGNITFTDTTLTSTNGNVIITFDPVASPAVSFSFTETGEFNAPQIVASGISTQQVNMGAATQVSSGTSMSCPVNVDTVIYTGTSATQHTFKVLLLIEGVEDSLVPVADTQSCEMMIAKSFRNDAVAGTVYGLVYTSTNPLATFSTRWNSVSSRIEVLCRPTSTTNSVTVRSFVTEMATTY